MTLKYSTLPKARQKPPLAIIATTHKLMERVCISVCMYVAQI